MIFYVSLFLFTVAVSAIALWFYRECFDIGKAAYQAIFPNSRQKYVEKKHVSLNAGLTEAATPWGWSSDSNPRRARAVKPAAPQPEAAAPWGWPGSKANRSASQRLADNISGVTESAREVVSSRKAKSGDETMVGWPYREEQFEFAGNKYKVSRKRKVKKTNVGGVSKPWGW
jgi:hypothetical protein